MNREIVLRINIETLGRNFGVIIMWALVEEKRVSLLFHSGSQQHQHEPAINNLLYYF